MNNSDDKFAKEIPLVSVIMPSYNHEKYIEEAVRSVWSQTYKNIELIVIDDGSVDRSVEILDGLKKQSPIPMRIIEKTNEGVCKALNTGLRESSGKYISILASDDRYLENKIEILTSIIEKSDNKFSFIYSRNLCINEDGSNLETRLPPVSKNIDNLFEDILLFKTFPTICSTLIKKDILFDLGGFNENYKAEDLDLLLRLTRNHKAIFCDKITYEYRVNIVGSLSRQIVYEDTIAIFNENIKFVEKSKNIFWKRYAHARLFNRISESYYIVNDLQKSKCWAIKSMITNPIQFKAYRLYGPSLLGLEAINFLRDFKNKVFKYSSTLLMTNRKRLER